METFELERRRADCGYCERIGDGARIWHAHVADGVDRPRQHPERDVEANLIVSRAGGPVRHRPGADHGPRVALVALDHAVDGVGVATTPFAE